MLLETDLEDLAANICKTEILLLDLILGKAEDL